jgi:hypothetical protein
LIPPGGGEDNGTSPVPRVSLTHRSSRAARWIAPVAILVVVGTPGLRPAEARPSAGAALHGTITTNAGQVALPGVEIVLIDRETAREIRRASTDGTGQFRIDQLEAGSYVLVARAPGFREARVGPLALAAGVAREVPIDLELSPVAESVDVRGTAGVARAESSSTAPVEGGMVDVLPVASDSYRALLPVLPGVVRQPDGRISVKGAKPTQGALVVGAGSGVDPSTGGFGVDLPSDAIETVDVVPNPYSAEDGRFSAGVVRIETRPGTAAWRATANSFIPMPCLTLCDGYSVGIRNYNPRVWFGGPIAGDRLFVSQAIEYRLAHARTPSLPDPDNQQRSQSFDAFTRVDVHPAAGHAVTASLAIFPRELQNAGMNTFNPQSVTPDVRSWGYQVAASDAVTLSPRSVLTSSFSASLYDVHVDPHGTPAMEVGVDGNGGTYFNRQRRRTHAFQWSESLTLLRPGRFGDHLLKAGADALWATYSGESASGPVVVRRADGTASWRQDFAGPTSQHVAGIDIAAYLQDRWQPHARVVVEAGVRVDHDGVLDATAVSPRVGVKLGVLPSEAGVLRGGVGVFRERTPLNIGAFGSMEAATVTAFAADGTTPIGAPVTWVHTTAPLDPPRAVIWNAEYDQRLSGRVVLKLNHLERNGSQEFVVNPTVGSHGPEVRLSSSGRSNYRETELSVRVGDDENRQTTVSYVRSRSRGDLNAYDLYFGTLRLPILQPNEFSVAPVDVPNRLIARVVFPVYRSWIASSLLEVRDGFPYSLVDENQRFVGPRNTGGRMPALCTLDVSLLRTGRLLGREVRYGVRFFHVLNTFEPRDVQNNVDSAAFGTYSNGLIRRIMFTTQLTGR